jgi:hypothetical protein
MITFLLMNLVVVVSVFLVVYKIIKLDNCVDSLLSLFIFYFAQIVISELLLGMLGILCLSNVIILNLLILLFVYFVTKNRESNFNTRGMRELSRELSGNKTVLFCASVILGFALVKLFINLINTPFGWDSLNYHFVFPVEWLKHGNLDIPITISDDPSPSYYPINGSLFYLWLIFPLKNVFLADLGQFPFFILSFLAVFNISRKLQLTREMSSYAAVLFSIIPNFFKQLGIAYVDVMVAALFLVCVNFLFLLTENFSWSSILTYSLSLGLLLGTKTVAVPYSIILYLPFVYLAFKNIKKLYLLLASLVIIVILGGFTYIRNFIDTGNPLYPLNLKLFGNTIFKGVMDNSVYRAHFKIEDYSLLKLLFHEGLGAQTMLFILPAIILAIPVTFIKNKKNITFNLIYFLILPILVYLIYRYIIPLANTRYLYPLLGLGMVLGFYVVKILNIPRIVTKTLVSICVLASIPELAKRQELIFAAVVTLFLLTFSPFLIRYLKKVRWVKSFFTIPLFLILIICLLAFLEKNYVINEYPRYLKMVKYSGFWPDAAKAWGWLNANTQSNNIAYVGRPVPFPLYGTNFKNNVYYVSVNSVEPAKLHYFPNSNYYWDYDFLSLHKNLEAKGNYRFAANYNIWLNNLLKRNTDYVFIYSLHQTRETMFPLEDIWVKSHPDRFIPVFMNETIHIYKVLR